MTAILALPVTWGLAGAGLAILCEYLYRVIPNPWMHYLPLWIALQTAIGYCVYRLVTMPNVSLIAAFITFSFCTAALRVSVSLFLLHDDIKAGTWAALCLVMLAKFVQSCWR